MSVTLIMTWDIKEGMEQEYFEFIMREWAPTTNQLGIQTVAAWYTLYRKDDTVPLIRAEAVAEDVDSIRQLLMTSEWQHIHEQLLTYVENYAQKLVETTGEFRI
jgi:hypothetical protein